MVDTGDSVAMADDTYRRDLGDGLRLRWSRPEDVERVVALYESAFRDSAEAPPNATMPHWTRDMFSGRHPHIGPRDFAVVEETASGAIVAATCLLRYPIAYEGITIPFGRPEVVATQAEYRNRGLVRELFALIHARSEARGDLVQGITGIPYYYRQFGYEYAVALESILTVYFPAIPALKPGATEPFTARKATAADIPDLLRLKAREQAGAAITTPLTPEYLRWAMEGMRAEAAERWNPYLLVDASGRVAGYFGMASARWSANVHVEGLMVEEGTPLTAVLPSALRAARALAEGVRPVRAGAPPAGALRFQLRNSAHPLSGALGEVVPTLASYPFSAFPYPWYIRVPDLLRFIQRIAPALERRLVASPQAGYTGELMLDFYRGGLRLALESGKLAPAEDWRRPLWGDGQAGFPPLVFLQLLFGYRSLDDLRAIYPDVWAEGEAPPLLNALFPRRPACLIPLD
jgi:hypothetical protein